MSRFYTSVAQYKGKLLHIGYENGVRIKEEVPLRPYVFVDSQKRTKYKNIHGKYVERIDFQNSFELKEFMGQYADVDNFNMYGMTNWPYVFIHDTYGSKVAYDATLIKVANIDIEVQSDGGFPHPHLAEKEVTAITVKYQNHYYVWGINNYTPHINNVTYVQCASEYELLIKFLRWWGRNPIDVVTGWNTAKFDIPYLVNRIRNELGELAVKKLSPWGIINGRVIKTTYGEHEEFDLVGIQHLDYMQLFQKFYPEKNQESFGLDNIGFVVLGEKKMDYSEYGSLNKLYIENHQKFIEYNIRDVELVDRIDRRLRFLELAYAIAYTTHALFQDTLGSVRVWDMLTYNYLGERGFVVPLYEAGEKEGQIEGAFVKEVQVGMHNWVLSFDLRSLYPHLIMQYNISPEMFRGQLPEMSVTRIMDTQLVDIRDKLIEKNVTVCPTGALFSRDARGFIPELMKMLFNSRTEYKNKMLAARQRVANGDKSAEDEEAMFSAFQESFKVLLNSGYGALTNQYFRWFRSLFAESITTSGQLTIKWAEKNFNAWLNEYLGTRDVDYVIALDTDSCYLSVDAVVRAHGLGDDIAVTVDFLDTFAQDVIQPKLDQWFQELADNVNAFEQAMYMKRENIGDKAIWVAKKRYMMNVWDSEGVRYTKPKLKVMGIEAVRKSTPYVVREKIKEAIKVIMSSDNDTLIDFIDRFRVEFNSLPFEDVAFPRSVNNLKNYSDAHYVFKKGTPQHVKAALLYNDALTRARLTNEYPLINEGEKIKFGYVLKPNRLHDTVIAFPSILPPEFGLHDRIDWKKQFEKTFLAPLENILEAIGWQTEHTNTLF